MLVALIAGHGVEVHAKRANPGDSGGRTCGGSEPTRISVTAAAPVAGLCGAHAGGWARRFTNIVKTSTSGQRVMVERYSDEAPV